MVGVALLLLLVCHLARARAKHARGLLDYSQRTLNTFTNPKQKLWQQKAKASATPQVRGLSFPPRFWVAFGRRDRVHSGTLTQGPNPPRRTQTDQDSPLTVGRKGSQPRGVLRCSKGNLEGPNVATGKTCESANRDRYRAPIDRATAHVPSNASTAWTWRAQTSPLVRLVMVLTGTGTARLLTRQQPVLRQTQAPHGADALAQGLPRF